MPSYPTHTHTNPAQTGAGRAAAGGEGGEQNLVATALTDLARSFALSTSRGFIFQLPAMKGTRAIIWHEGEGLPRGAVVVTPAPWKAVAGATKADPAPKPASVNREVSFIVERRRGRERGGVGRGKRKDSGWCEDQGRVDRPAHTQGERGGRGGGVDIAEPLLALALSCFQSAVWQFVSGGVSASRLFPALAAARRGRRERETDAASSAEQQICMVCKDQKEGEFAASRKR